MDGYVVLGSAVVGLLVGVSGAGGGALMTPMLILLFSVKPAAAISSDLVAAVFMRPVGAAVHAKRGTVNFRLVGWLSVGSVPAALFGTWLLHEVSSGQAATVIVERGLGAALLLGVLAMAVRHLLDRRCGVERGGDVAEITIRVPPTVAIGLVVGVVVGMTSVGSGSLVVILLMSLYPSLAAKRLVGTDLVQAIPLTAAAAIGSLAFGHVQLAVTTAIIVGSVPAVLAGSLLSSVTSDGLLRPVIFLVILASGLKYAGMSTTDLGWSVGAAGALVLLDAALSRRRPAQSGWAARWSSRRGATRSVAAVGSQCEAPASISSR